MTSAFELLGGVLLAGVFLVAHWWAEHETQQ